MTLIAAAAIATGLGLYGYTAFRATALPILFVFYVDTRRRSGSAGPSGLVVAFSSRPFIVFAVIVLALLVPMIAFALDEPDLFLRKMRRLWIPGGDDPVPKLIRSFLSQVLMLVFGVESNRRENFAKQSLLGPLVSISFVFGITVAIATIWHRLRRRSRPQSIPYDPVSWMTPGLAGFLLIWILAGLLPAMVAGGEAAKPQRAIVPIVPIMITAAIGSCLLWRWLDQNALTIPRGRFLKTLLAVFTGLLLIHRTVSLYFGLWARHHQVRNAFEADTLELARFIDRLPDEAEKFLVVGREWRGDIERSVSAQPILYVTETATESSRRARNLYFVGAEEVKALRPTSLTPVFIPFKVSSDDLKPVAREIAPAGTIVRSARGAGAGFVLEPLDGSDGSQ